MKIKVDKYWGKLVCNDILNYGNVRNGCPKAEGVFNDNVFSEEFYFYGVEVENVLKLLLKFGAIGKFNLKLGVGVDLAVPGVAEGVYVWDSYLEFEQVSNKYKNSIESICIEHIDYDKVQEFLDRVENKVKVIGKKVYIGDIEIILGNLEANLLKLVIDNKIISKLELEEKLYGIEGGLEYKNTRIRDLIKSINKKVSPFLKKSILNMEAEVVSLV